MNFLKKSFIALLGVAFLFGSIAYTDAAVKVKGYYRKDGTYVQSHYRSDPDSSPYNNWSYPGNVNPYTGEVAGGNPDTYLKNYSGSSGSSYSLPSQPTTQPTSNQLETAWQQFIIKHPEYRTPGQAYNSLVTEIPKSRGATHLDLYENAHLSLIASLQAQLNALLSQVAQLQAMLAEMKVTPN